MCVFEPLPTVQRTSGVISINHQYILKHNTSARLHRNMYTVLKKTIERIAFFSTNNLYIFLILIFVSTTVLHNAYYYEFLIPRFMLVNIIGGYFFNFPYFLNTLYIYIYIGVRVCVCIEGDEYWAIGKNHLLIYS